ncbi:MULTISPECIES: S8 family serine peptidase [unclassified Bradyrhizobium]|uniref:S8 family serine peptidase n=1 Tax=unclassified Bradyrhizobium TaxID=2631580 RepID=UPI002013559B|nr:MULTISPECIES: S8 family serine peptidase [unclassified Bradyrhizobium]
MTKPRSGSTAGHRRIVFGAMIAAATLAMSFAVARAQSIMNRGPQVNSINVGPRVAPTVAPTVSATVGPRMPNVNLGNGLTPNVRYSPNLNYQDPTTRGQTKSASGNSAGQSGGGSSPRGKKNSAPDSDRRFVPRELVIEVDGNPTDAEADAIARRHRLTRLQSQSFPLIGSTMFRWRIPDNRSVSTVVRELVADNVIKSAQPNYRFTLQQAAVAVAEGDPAQYALARLRLPEAHGLARGDNITIAVIDSGIDVSHPELAGVIGGTFDALGSKEGPHAHGTGIAGVIAAHARLMGTSPSANLLAIRAFGVAGSSAESTSFVLLRSLDYAVSKGARVINMSFAGPEDPLLGKSLAAAAGKGVILVAASGNAGPKSPPLYPAADRNVIAVSATDASDRLFPASNRGSHIAIAAPGVDILTSAPDAKYQVTSGTSFAAAYISGLVALMLERNPALTASDVRGILAKTAQDLGAPGRDDLFGAGRADALAAVQAAGAPVATASGSGAAAGEAPQPTEH